MTWNPAAQAYLEARSGHVVRWLLHLTVKDRATGDPVPYGLWTGVDDRAFDIGNGPETFQAMHDHFVPPVMTFEPGTYIRKVSIEFIHLHPDAQNVLSAYDARLAPATLHTALFDADMNLLDIRRRFKGFVNEAPQFTPAKNGVAKAQLDLVSTARRGTATISAKKSDAAQQRRGGDRFRRYGSLGTVVSDWWGNKG